jgi:hypothetical protein
MNIDYGECIGRINRRRYGGIARSGAASKPGLHLVFTSTPCSFEVATYVFEDYHFATVDSDINGCLC